MPPLRSLFSVRCGALLAAVFLLGACDSGAGSVPVVTLQASYEGRAVRDLGTAEVGADRLLTAADLVAFPDASGPPYPAGPRPSLFSEAPVVYVVRDAAGALTLKAYGAGVLPTGADVPPVLAFAPAAFLADSIPPVVYRYPSSGADSVQLVAGRGVLPVSRTAAFEVDDLSRTQRLVATVSAVEGGANLTPVLMVRYRPGFGCEASVRATLLVRHPLRERGYTTPPEGVELPFCAPRATPGRRAPVDAVVAVLQL